VPNTNITQHCFNHGELSPTMRSRSDLGIYMKSLRKAYNVVIKPEGTVSRRFCTEYMTDVTSIAGNGSIMVSSFDYSASITYTVIFTENKISIYHEGVLKDTLVTTYTASELENMELRFTQTVDSLIIVHEDHAPAELTRQDDTHWTYEDLKFKEVAAHDFDEINYDDMIFLLSVATVGSNRDLSSDTDIFTADYVGGLFIGIGTQLSDELGVARITSYIDAKHVKVDISSPFADSYTLGVKGKQAFLGEPAWGAARGYPISVTSYEGRLWFGGVKSIRNLIVGSVSNNIRNFDRGAGQDSDSIQLQIQSTVSIEYIFGGKSLQIFTSREEFGSSELDGKELTPSNRPIKLQSRNGISNVAPQVLDNQTFYVKKGGKGVMNFIYDDNQATYKSNEISIVSSHLIKDPIDSAVLAGSSHEAANYYFLLNSDGSIACYQTMIEEQVSAWSDLDFTTSNGVDTVTRITSVGGEIILIVKRIINGGIHYYMERIAYQDVNNDEYYLMDCCLHKTLSTPSDFIGDLGVFNDRIVQVIADGYYCGEFEVLDSNITIQFEATELYIGFGFNTEIKTLPIDVEVNPIGRTGYINKRIVNVTIDYVDSYGIYVNNTLLVKFLKYGDTLDFSPPKPQTGIDRLDFVNGWEPRDGVTIGQNTPSPMNLLAINYEMRF